MTVPLISAETATETVSYGQKFKEGVLWLGRMIKEGFIKFGQLIKEAWTKAAPHLKAAATKVGYFLRTGPGIALIAGSIGTILGLSAEALGTNDAVAISLKVAAVACFIGMGIAIGIGIMSGLTVPLL